MSGANIGAGGYNVVASEKVKKNNRKINSGVPNKLLIGRSG
jgi:hypothetical protein